MNSDFIMQSFWQSPSGYNCATIAVIKVALIQYGTKRVFRVSRRREGYRLTLQNGDAFTISRKEVAQLNRGNGIRFSKYRVASKAKQLTLLKEYVQLCYAVMLTYLNLIGFNRQRFSLKEAREYLQDGFGDDDPINTDHLYRFLGLHIKSGRVKDLKKRNLEYIRSVKALVLYSPRHVVAVSDGYYDYYGTPKRIKNKKPKLGSQKARWWYELK